MLGKLSWAAIPFNEPLPLLSGAVVGIVILAILVFVTVKGWWPYLWREWLTSVDHKRIGVMYVVLGLVMLLRGFSDAIMMRTQQAIAVGDAQGYLPSAALRPGLLGARHDHDLFRGDAARHWTDELCCAVAARRARRRFPDAQLGQLLAHRNRRAADQRVTCHRRFLARELVGLSAALRARLFARCRRRLLPLVIADLGRRHVADRHQFRDDDSQIARPGHDLFPHAGILLDRARRQSVDRRRVSGPDRDLRDAAA